MLLQDANYTNDNAEDEENLLEIIGNHASGGLIFGTNMLVSSGVLSQKILEKL